MLNFTLGQMSSGKLQSINTTYRHNKYRSVVFTELIAVPVNCGQSDSAGKCNSGKS